MNLVKTLEEMRKQYALLQECIESLEQLAAKKPRRGRPPQWLTKAKSAQSSKQANPIGSDENQLPRSPKSCAASA